MAQKETEQRREQLLSLADLPQGLRLVDVGGEPTTIMAVIPIPQCGRHSTP
jgi:hypothetical protein